MIASTKRLTLCIGEGVLSLPYWYCDWFCWGELADVEIFTLPVLFLYILRLLLTRHHLLIRLMEPLNSYIQLSAVFEVFVNLLSTQT